MPEPLSQVASVKGDITVMGNNDNSLATKDCVVGPA